MSESTIQARIIEERPTAESGVSVNGNPLDARAGLGVGAHEGADRTSRELGMWRPALQSPDREINSEKPTLDARGRDLVRNVGMMQGGVALHRNSIVGSHFRLNSRPDYRFLGLGDTWADEFQREVESKFTLFAESPDCWIDAARMNTLTGLVRLAIGQFFFSGEVLSTLEWMRPAALRPYRTAVQMVDPDRLSNPNGQQDTEYLRRGIERDVYGAPSAYHIRAAHPTDQLLTPLKSNRWVRVPVRKSWGRLMVVHIIEQMRPDQSRGVAEMVSVLKEMRMTQRFHDITLQNAVVNATFAAAIESELPPEVAMEMVGVVDSEGSSQQMTQADAMLQAIAQYTGGAKNLHIDGVKIPHLYPNTKLKLYPAGSPGGVGEGFEKSLLRYVARGLGLSYEQFTGDYSETNYSSARASMNETWKYMQARKKIVADRFATIIFRAWLEEAINAGQIATMPAGLSIYDPMVLDALSQCAWIGASRGQVDEAKETKAAAERIAAGLSTLEKECAALGEDWRDVIDQRAREIRLLAEKGVTVAVPAAQVGHNVDDPSKEDPDEKSTDKTTGDDK